MTFLTMWAAPCLVRAFSLHSRICVLPAIPRTAFTKALAHCGQKRILLKAGSGIYQQEPYNEIVASALYDTLGMPHVSYWLVDQGGQVMSACECFTDERTELVTAAQFMRLLPQQQGISNWQHFNDCCNAVGISDAQKMSAICWPPIIS